MDNARLIFNNVWDTAILAQSKGSTEPALTIENSQKYNNSRIFRTSDTAEVEILFDFSSPEFIEAFSLWRHNLTSSAQIRIELFNDANQTGDLVYDSGLLYADIPKTLGDMVFGKDPLGISAYTGWETATRSIWFDQTYVVKSGRLTITNPDNPDGYIEIGRIYSGEVFSPRFNTDLGHSFKWETDVSQKPTAGGTVHTLDAATYRTLSFNLSHLDSSDRAVFADLTRILSTHKDFFIALRPNIGGAIERDYSFAAKFTQIPSIKAQASRYETQCNIREV